MQSTGERVARWWRRGVIYQVYPRSFQDSNGDGIGDLAGVTQRLDYLTWLGVHAVWLSPFSPSPMADFGYDVSDYVDVDPIFGTLADFDAMLADADLGPNEGIVIRLAGMIAARLPDPWYRSVYESFGYRSVI